jgi:hypothetical protein
MTANQFYEQYLKEIAVDPHEIKKAKTRRDDLAVDAMAALRALGLSSPKWFPTGALAMGTQIAPLNDVDLVVFTQYVREGWGEKPMQALNDLAWKLDLINDGKTKPSTHAVKVVWATETFTADVVYGATKEHYLVIPHCPKDEKHKWIKTNPRSHAQMVRDRNKDLGFEFARTIRILKSLNRKWGLEAADEKKPLSSWHLTALALTLIKTKQGYAERIPDFLVKAAVRVKDPLKDPSGVGPALEARDPAKASALLADAAEKTRRAASDPNAERILRDVLGDPAVMLKAVTGGATSFGVGGVLLGTEAGRTTASVRAYGDAD